MASNLVATVRVGRVMGEAEEGITGAYRSE